MNQGGQQFGNQGGQQFGNQGGQQFGNQSQGQFGNPSQGQFGGNQPQAQFGGQQQQQQPQQQQQQQQFGGSPQQQQQGQFGGQQPVGGGNFNTVVDSEVQQFFTTDRPDGRTKQECLQHFGNRLSPPDLNDISERLLQDGRLFSTGDNDDRLKAIAQ